MGNIDKLLVDYKLHHKSRTEKHPSYPSRFYVPDDKTFWELEFSDYAPVEFNAPIVLDINTPWAEPQDIREINREITSFTGKISFTENGVPLNPFGRTGISGRGVLGKWGANFAVDGLLTSVNPDNSLFQVLSITRKDTNQIALPGGMVDPGEEAIETRNRELAEELSLNPDDLKNPYYEKTIFRGYIDDPRNTDNAWLESTVIHTHLSHEKASQMILSARDDAKDFHWLEVTKDNIFNFYANHGLILLVALQKLIKSGNASERAGKKFINTFMS